MNRVSTDTQTTVFYVTYPPEKNREYLKQRYQDQRAAFYEYLGGACVSCGSMERLEIDHIDKRLKSFDVGRLWAKRDLPKVYQELDKCQLLCNPCHCKKSGREFSEERTGTFTHGTVYGWMKAKCDCDACYAYKREWHDARNAARRTVAGRGPYEKRF